MIAKNKKGRSFGGTVRYVLNEGHEPTHERGHGSSTHDAEREGGRRSQILEAEGVLTEDTASIIRDFAIQRSGRPEIKHPVGHIPIAFSPDDSPKLTDGFMRQLAYEYMEEMGIRNTQFIIVRHHDTGNPHLHIVYNRIDNNLKVISVNNDYKRNIKACKKLKDKHGLTYGKGKEKVNRQKLTGADKVRYLIHDEITANLPKCNNYEDLEKRLRQSGITIRYKYRSVTEESPENIQGISFEKNKSAFKASEIDRKFSHANLMKSFAENMEILREKQAERQSEPPKQQFQQASASRTPSIEGVELIAEQWNTLQNGGHIYLENMNKKDGSGKFSAYVFLNDEKGKAFFSNENPDKMIEHGGITIRLRDKILVEKGHITKAKMKWWGGIDYQYPFVWKDHQNNEIKYSFADPRIPKEVHEKEIKEFKKRIQQNISSPKKGPKIGR
ncbi:MAG: relaxase/mobilization nuclease domain-containing protein [Rikenellaceae bacterium]|nr:relaxase/mobilization nuclease domain-containing protein [Rikenellaceae bacterium]MCL2692951.1 relaxase/mobilization nuclease domain-containing protein [Rikenellaceae bacterium]